METLSVMVWKYMKLENQQRSSLTGKRSTTSLYDVGIIAETGDILKRWRYSLISYENMS